MTLQIPTDPIIVTMKMEMPSIEEKSDEVAAQSDDDLE